jgi:hypothetical protein
VNSLHRFIGYAVPAGFLLLALWGLLSFFRNRDPGGGFWNLLAVLQVIIGVQFIVGAVLYLSGARPATDPSWLHYIYGAFFPALVLGVAHRLAAGRFARFPWAVFAVAGFVDAAATFRALQTGLGLA